MPNKYHANLSAPGSSQPKGGKGGGKMNMKDSGFPGVPGKTQSKNRSNGVAKAGKLGPFNVKSEGI